MSDFEPHLDVSDAFQRLFVCLFFTYRFPTTHPGPERDAEAMEALEARERHRGGISQHTQPDGSRQER